MPALPPAWRDHRNRQRAVVFSVAAFVTARGAGLLCGISRTAAVLAASVTLTACVAAVVWFAAFRCPFCRLHFHWTWLVSNPFARRCLHCGFEKHRDPHAGRAYGSRTRY